MSGRESGWATSCHASTLRTSFSAGPTRSSLWPDDGDFALWRALVIDHIAKSREAVIAKSIEVEARRGVHSSRGKVTDLLLKVVERLYERPLPPSQKSLLIP